MAENYLGSGQSGAQFRSTGGAGNAPASSSTAALTNYGNISQRTAAYAAKQMLEHAEPILVLSKFGQSKPMPKNSSDTIAFRRPVPLGVQYEADGVTPLKLVEGVPPSEQQIKYEDVWVKLNQYGGLVKITDVVQDLSEDPVLSDASMLCGEQAAETVEMLTWGVIRGGTNVFRAGPLDASSKPTKAASRAEVAGKINLGQIRAVTRSLKSARAKPVTSMMGSSVNFGTESVEGGYIAFCHTDCENDIRELPGFIHLADYGSRKPLAPEEIGSCENVRFLMSPLLLPFSDAGAAVATEAVGMVSTTGTQADVYPVVIIAKHAFGLVPLKGAKAITPTVLNPGTPSKSDPLGQIGFVGWKSWFAATILNETWMSRFEVAVTEL
jgi:N4-gp56 family major capsid protein